MNKIALLRAVCISAKRWYAEPWMTLSIETATRKSKKLYKEMLKNNSDTAAIAKYKQLRNMLNRLKRTTMKNYYNEKCQETTPTPGNCGN